MAGGCGMTGPTFGLLASLTSACTADKVVAPADTSDHGSSGPDSGASADGSDSTDDPELPDPDLDAAEGPWSAFDGHPEQWCAIDSKGQIACYSGTEGRDRCFGLDSSPSGPALSISVADSPDELDLHRGSALRAVHYEDAAQVWGGWCQPAWPATDGTPDTFGRREPGAPAVAGEWWIETEYAWGEGSGPARLTLLQGGCRATDSDGFPDDDTHPRAAESVTELRANKWGLCSIDVDGVARCAGFMRGSRLITYEYEYGDIPGGDPYAVWHFENAVLVDARADVTTGFLFACGLTAAGEATCDWAREGDYDSELSPLNLPSTALPPDMSAPPGVKFTDLEADFHHICGMTVEGGVECWGDTERLSTTSIPGPFVDISPWCGLTPEGSIECWTKTALQTYPCTLACDRTGCR